MQPAADPGRAVPAAPAATRPSLRAALLAEAVRCAERAGPLDDADVLRTAWAAAPDGPGRVQARARLLAERLGLPALIDRARAGSGVLLLAIAALVLVAGLGLADRVLGGGGRQINVMAALAGLLGLHGLTLLAWVGSVLFAPRAFRLSLGGLWLLLTARVAGGRQGQGPLLLQAAWQSLARARLLPWALGLASHAVWALAFAVALAWLLFALAFHRYTLAWETTILSPGFFVRSVQALGWLPAQIGFPVPDAATVLAATSAPSATDPAGQRSWALWLTGCLAVYGLLPRLLLVALCTAVCRARRAALQPDLSEPYYRQVLARFDALAPPRIVDADPGRPVQAAPQGLPPGEGADLLLVVGFELLPEAPWPPAGLPPGAEASAVDGSAAQRSALLDRLALLRPRRVLVACDASASPDRGTERFLRAVAGHCGTLRLWLVPPADTDPARSAAAARRWQAWLKDCGLVQVTAHVGTWSEALERTP
ncbi:DUF2868 domain-containing protein [Sphingomonas sp. NCPPB 2930]